MSAITLDLPMPPSVNTLWRHAGKVTYISETYREWKSACDAEAMLRGWRKKRIPGRFTIAIVLNQDKRRGDADNRIKPVLDWLQRVEIIEDDKFAERVSVSWGEAPKGCRVTLEPFVEEVKFDG